MRRFWSSVELTGNQTHGDDIRAEQGFWSSVELTGNQTFEVSAYAATVPAHDSVEVYIVPNLI